MIKEITFDTTSEAKEFINSSFLKSTKRKGKTVFYEKFSVDGVDYDNQADYYNALNIPEPEEAIVLEIPVEEAVIEQMEKTEILETKVQNIEDNPSTSAELETDIATVKDKTETIETDIVDIKTKATDTDNKIDEKIAEKDEEIKLLQKEIEDVDLENKNLKERLDSVVIDIPYFQQACQLILFLKANTASYPNTMKSFRKIDDELIEDNSYDGMTQGEKATLLSNKVIEDLKLNIY